jgi:hypothetical protein
MRKRLHKNPEVNLSNEELEAERLYYSLVSWSLCKKAFVIKSKDLEARSPIAGAYLRWLILRGQEWPKVGRGPSHFS